MANAARTRLEREIANEPERIRASYEVRAHRLEPVGLVYLWPVSGLSAWPPTSIAIPTSNGSTMSSRSASSSPPAVLKELGLSPRGRRQIDTAAVASAHRAGCRRSRPSRDPWAFVETVLGWEARHVAGAPGGPGPAR